jgi:hypothetical protein
LVGDRDRPPPSFAAQVQDFADDGCRGLEVKEEFEPAQPLSPATPVAEPLDDSPVRA